MSRKIDCLLLLLLWSRPAGAANAPTSVEQRFAEARKNTLELYAFLLRMPKGGDLHNHLSGAVYAESYLRAAAEDGLCVDLLTRAVTARPSESAAGCGPDRVEAARMQSDNTLWNSMIDSLSMRNFVAGAESGHDHFFATFGKFGPSKEEHRGEFIAEVARRAAEQNESYLELMAINGSAANALGSAAGFSEDFEALKQKLIAAGLPDVVEKMRTRVQQQDRAQRAALGCDSQPDSAACRLKVRYVFEVLRENPKERVFAQALAGFLLAANEPLLVGVNFVQPEDGIVSMRDYHLHMRMVEFLRRSYPQVRVTLHAGELAPGLVPPDGLRFHIREAVEIAGAERIGHGADLMYENDATALLERMKQRHVLVEINLTSNDLILGMRGGEHPLPVYRKHGVPVALSTDDEAVSRGHLTAEYVRAAQTYNLSYADLKELARNSLEYSFLPGESYWRNHSYRTPCSACGASPKSESCQQFLKNNEKRAYRFGKFFTRVAGSRKPQPLQINLARFGTQFALARAYENREVQGARPIR
jgi:hypothetical protein